MAEISRLQQLSNALKSYKGSKAAAYVDALPEMVASGASGMAAAIPGVIDAVRGDGPLVDRAQRFKDTQEALSFDPSIDPRVLSEVDAAIPEVVKDASAGYSEWEKAHPILSMGPGMVAGSLRGLKPFMEWKQLEGHPQEAEIRASGRMPIPGTDSWVHWNPRNVDERGIPSGMTIKSGVTKAIPGQGSTDDYTSFSRNGAGTDLDYMKVGGSYNNLSGPGSGGLKRYEDAMSLLTPNDIGIGSSGMNTQFSTAAWEKLARNMNDLEAGGFTPSAVPIRRGEYNRMTFLPGGNRFAEGYLQNPGRGKGNFLMLPPEMAARVLRNDDGVKNAGLPKSATGQNPNIAATYARLNRRLSTDQVTGGKYYKPVYGTADEVMAMNAASPTVRVSPNSTASFAAGRRYDADNAVVNDRDENGVLYSDKIIANTPRGEAAYNAVPEYIRALRDAPHNNPAYTLRQAQGLPAAERPSRPVSAAAVFEPRPDVPAVDDYGALPLMEVEKIDEPSKVDALREQLARAQRDKRALAQAAVDVGARYNRASDGKREQRMRADAAERNAQQNMAIANDFRGRAADTAAAKREILARKRALARQNADMASDLASRRGDRSTAEALRMKNAALIEMLRGQ